MSLLTKLQPTMKDDYKKIVDAIEEWAGEQSKFTGSVFLRDTPEEAYRQALKHLIHSLHNKEEII